MPKVSVIVTTYNRKEYLTETIQSILNQTFRDFELIVVDNYSNYDFFALIESFKNDKIIPFQNQNNGIIAVNRNVGIKHAKGEYIAFCDDDDVWINTKLQDQVTILDETNCDLVYSNMFLFKEDITNIIGNTSNREIKNLKNLIDNNPIITSSVLVKNSDIFFPDNPNLVAIEDYALWLNLYLKGFRFKFLEKPLIYFRISGTNISTNKKMYITKHLKLIYLYVSLLIQNPYLPIKIQIIRKIGLDYLKFWVKSIKSK
jgi:glycosyltransferase involved in cell wall biosynthesis